MPPSSVYVEMTDNSTYGKIIHKLKEFQGPPPWIESVVSPRQHGGYIHFENNHRFHTVKFLNSLTLPPRHDSLLYGPRKAYIRISNNRYFTAVGFDNFHVGMTNFDRSMHIFVAMPRGPIFSAVLIEHKDIVQGFILTPQLLNAYIRVDP